MWIFILDPIAFAALCTAGWAANRDAHRPARHHARHRATRTNATGGTNA